MGGDFFFFSPSLNICIHRIQVENNKSRIRIDLRCWSSSCLKSRGHTRWIIGGVYVYHSRKNSSWKLVCCGGNGSDFIRLTGIIARGWISYVRIANSGRSHADSGSAPFSIGDVIGRSHLSRFGRIRLISARRLGVAASLVRNYVAR